MEKILSPLAADQVSSLGTNRTASMSSTESIAHSSWLSVWMEGAVLLLAVNGANSPAVRSCGNYSELQTGSSIRFDKTSVTIQSALTEKVAKSLPVFTEL